MPDPLNGGFESVGAASEKELRWSQWWVDHREHVRKAGLGLFVAADLLLVGYGFWGFVDWLAFGGLKEDQAIRQMTSPEYGRVEGVALEEVQIGAPMVLSGAAGKIDVLASIENRNRMFWAEVDYRFLIGGVPQPLQQAFVLPMQAKYLTQLGAAVDAGSAVELKIERRVWRRVSLQGAAGPEAFAEPRLGVRALNPLYLPSDPLATSPVSSAKFTLSNETAFGYYDVDLLVLLYRGDAIVGANTVRVDAIKAGEKKLMELFWYQILPQVTKVEVVPHINIYDPNVYRAPR